MSTPGAPVGQIAYQAIMAKQLQAAWLPYVRTANRYTCGPVGSQLNAQGGMISPVALMLVPLGGRSRRSMLVGGNAVFVTATGGANYVANDFVTFSPINGGRSVVIKIISLTGSGPNLCEVIDPGSGMTGGGTGVSSTTTQTAALTQLSTTGIGTGATWTATVAIGLGLGPQPRPNT